MIEFLEKNEKLNHTQSLVITYPRTVQITFGNYPYPDQIHNLIIEIKKNITENNSYASNVKGGKTDWMCFVNHPLITKFINHCINKHQTSNPSLFEFFYDKKTIINAWGNEIKKNDYVDLHDHPCYHGILYLTEGAPLILPDLNLKIIPKPGDYYFFPPNIIHYVNKSDEDKNRYNIVLNIIEIKDWDRQKRIEKKLKQI